MTRLFLYRLWTAVLLTLLLSFGGVTYAGEAGGGSISANAAAQQSVDMAAFSTLDGTSLKLSDLRGKAVYIKFWATWCPLCLAGLEDFARLANDETHAGTTAFISVVSPGLKGEVDRQDFIEWAQAQQLDFPVLLDEAGLLAESYDVRFVPASVYLDEEGRLAKKHTGDEMNERILDTLSEIRKK